ncbi:MAG: hypothetical protein LBB75_03745, partial [Oscillospiraceae bacterium]|nr:hypothetical protein [Oscillospiraceae bacterium]
MTAKLSQLTTEEQKAHLSSRLSQSYIAPMELKLLRMQMQLAAKIEGHPLKQPDDREMELIAARNEIALLEAKLAAFTAAFIMQYRKRKDDGDGQQRI